MPAESPGTGSLFASSREGLQEIQDLVCDLLDRTNATTGETRKALASLDELDKALTKLRQRNHELREEIQRLEGSLREIERTEGMYDGIVSDFRHIARAALAGDAR